MTSGSGTGAGDSGIVGQGVVEEASRGWVAIEGVEDAGCAGVVAGGGGLWRGLGLALVGGADVRRVNVYVLEAVGFGRQPKP